MSVGARLSLSASCFFYLAIFVLSAWGESTSLYVVDADTGAVVRAKNEHSPLAPASVLKLVISTAALKRWGGEHQFSTQFLIRQDKGQNDLVVVGGGDPNFTTEDLYLVTKELKRRGLKTIRNLVVDDTKFLSTNRQGLRAFESSAHALSFNFNSIRVWSCIGVDGKITAGVDPESYSPPFVTDIRVGKSSALNIGMFEGEGVPLKISGTLSKDEPCIDAYRSVDEVPKYFGTVFKKLLQDQGIVISGQLIQGQAGPNDKDLYQFNSKPLSQILWGLNHFSTNMIAEVMLSNIGCQSSCSREQGLRELQETLTKLGASNNEFHLEDASGLSHANRISAYTLYLVMKAAISDPLVQPEFLSSLSRLGVSGTLKRRKNGDDKILFRGKTGSLDGVSSIAGLLVSKTGKRLLVVMLENDIADKGRAVAWEDSVIDELYDQ